MSAGGCRIVRMDFLQFTFTDGASCGTFKKISFREFELSTTLCTLMLVLGVPET